jgi:uncharacterized protein (TIGR03118 family)
MSFPFWSRRRTFHGRHRYRPALECLEDRYLLSGGFVEVNLASDLPGMARVTDPNLVNPWGIAFSPTGPFWFADNGSGVSDVLDGRGQPVPLVAMVPSATRSGSAPTGTVFNDGSGFAISADGVAAPSRFLFATEDGTIAGWSALVDPTRAILAVDNSSLGAVYKGLALAADPAGRRFLFAADFSRGTIDVFDQDFRPVLRQSAFHDPNLPNGFAPFNVQNIDNLLFVTYAKQDDSGYDAVAGAGHGIIDVYDTDGSLVRRFASAGALDAPWGLALAPTDFAPFAGALLVSNNGDGRIIAYDPVSGSFLGTLADDRGIPIAIPGLWALTFGNGHLGGAADTLFFTAGVGDEAHGLFGAIQTTQRRGTDTAGPGTFDPHAPGEPGDYPLPPRHGPAFQDSGDGSRLATAVLLPLTQSSLILVPTLETVARPNARGDAPGQPTAVTADSLPFNAFLDLNAAQVSLENSAAYAGPHTERPQPQATALGATDQDFGIGEERADSAAPIRGHDFRTPTTDRIESADNGAATSERLAASNRASWKELLTNLLIAIGVPMTWTICRGPSGRQPWPPGTKPRGRQAQPNDGAPIGANNP